MAGAEVATAVSTFAIGVRIGDDVAAVDVDEAVVEDVDVDDESGAALLAAVDGVVLVTVDAAVEAHC